MAAQDIAAFENWLQTGGPSRAGLAPGVAEPLAAQLVQLRATLGVVFSVLGEVRQVWGQMTVTPEMGDNAARVLIATIISDLSSADHLLDDAREQVGAVQVGIDTLQGALDRQTEADRQEIARQTALSGELEANIRSLNQRLQDIYSELDGPEGFFKGMALVFSLGIYNPLEENKAKIRAELARTEARRIEAQNARAQAAQRQRELDECSQAIERLRHVDQMVAELANDVSEGQRELTLAYDTALKSVREDGTSLAQIYTRLAARRVAELVQWIDRPHLFA